MCGFLRIMLKIGGTLLLISAAFFLAYRCLLPAPKYLMTEKFFS